MRGLIKRLQEKSVEQKEVVSMPRARLWYVQLLASRIGYIPYSAKYTPGSFFALLFRVADAHIRPFFVFSTFFRVSCCTFFLLLLLLSLSPGGSVKTKLKVTTLPRSSFVSCVNFNHSSRCNISTGCCCYWRLGTYEARKRLMSRVYWGAYCCGINSQNYCRVVYTTLFRAYPGRYSRVRTPSITI